MKRAVMVLSLLILVLLLSGAGMAQDTEDRPDHPLFEMLGIVPWAAALPGENRYIDIHYADYRALEAAHPDVPTPESWAAWKAMMDNKDAPEGSMWLANSMRLTSGWQGISRITVLEDVPDVVGFDVFDIDQTLLFGQPPSMGLILRGDFDAEAIAAAHTARDYTQTDVDGVTLWCGPVGCENGQQVDPANRNLNNIFGGDLGRQQPFAVVPGHILNSGDLSLLNAMVATSQDKAQSLLDLAEYWAAAEASITGGDLIQVHFLSPTDVGYGPTDPFNNAPNSQQIIEDYGDLPAYSLVAMADRQEGDDQVAMLALVYLNEADATQAAMELTRRLARMPYDPEGENLTPFLEEESLGASLDEPRVYFSEAAQRWVAIAAVRYPLPPDEVSESGLRITPGRVYQLWMRAFYSRMLTPLLIAFE